MMEPNVMLLFAGIALTYPILGQTAECVTSCAGSRYNGHYQSCKRCDGFVQCGHGRLWEMPCAPGTVWDDALKTCNHRSTTCPGNAPKQCDNPPPVLNGMFLPQGSDPQSALLICKYGFLPTPPDYTITCVDGSWPNMPTNLCMPAVPKCGIPPPVQNGIFRRLKFDRQCAMLICKPGFLPPRPDYNITCVKGSWQNVLGGLCVPEIQRCGNPPPVLNGQFYLQNTKPQPSAALHCQSGFVPTLPNLAITCVDGTWPDISDDACMREIPKCGSPPAVQNGFFNSLGTDSQSAILQCKDGFTPKDTDFNITCNEGTWPSLPNDACVPVFPKCGSPPAVQNGVFRTQGIVIQSAILQCKEGFMPKGSEDAITCDEGTWPDVPDDACVPAISKCGSPPPVTNGKFVSQGTDRQSAILQCKDGYKPKQPGFTLECDKGWLPNIPEDICLPVIAKCKSPPSVTNGKFVSQGTDDQSALLQCKDGFKPKQPGFILVCEKGTWPFVPDGICEPAIPKCKSPPTVTNGKFVSQGTDGQSAILQCKDGFKPKQPGYILTCDKGTWPNVPDDICVLVIPKCGGLPPVTNGKFVSQGTDDQSGMLQCKDGYKPKQPEFTLVCDMGAWPNVPEDLCMQAIPKCGSPPPVSNGKFVNQGINGQSAILQCKNGFEPKQPGFTLTCDKGTWPIVPNDICMQVIPKCGSPPTVTNGKFVPDATGSKVVLLQCKDGFSPRKPGFMIACDKGEWPKVPEDACIPDGPPCGTPPAVENGAFVRESDRVVVPLECYEDFIPTIPGFTITCNGTFWSDVPGALCVSDEVSDSCGDLPLIENGRYKPDVDHQSAVLACDDEFIPAVPDLNIKCINGSWYGETDGVCISDANQRCGPKPRLTNGEFKTRNDVDSAILECGSGFVPAVPDYGITCDGEWKPEVPDNICVPELVSDVTGRDFYLAFFENFSARFKGALTIYLTSSEPGNVTITSRLAQDTIHRLDGVVTTKVHKNPKDFLMVRADKYKVSEKVLRIQSTVDLNVYAYNGQLTTSDATIVFPVRSLGKEYILVAGPENPAAVIIATEPDTFVNISYPHGTFKYTSLDEREAFYIPGRMSPSNFRLTGTVITASSPVAVFTGNKCTRVPSTMAACDTLIEQVPCVSSLQRVYVLSYMHPRPAFRVQVVATEDGTTIEISSVNGTKTTHKKNRREDVIQDFINNDTVYVIADRPIMVAQYAFGQAFDHVRSGDPSLMIIPGISQYRSEYLFTSLSDVNLSFTYEWVYLIIKRELRAGLRLNGEELVSELEVDIEVPKYATYTVVYVHVMKEIEQRLVHIDGMPFGAMQYGAAPFNEYGFALGFKMKRYKP